jgi:hypothetical protein
MQPIESSPVMKRNPRPRKYASDAERQAAYRSRYPMLEFRAEPNTTETLTRIAETLDINRSELLLSMVKFALANHDWARFGLTHKTLPFYRGNPMATKKPSPAQLAARQKFADMVRARAAAAKGKKMPKKTVKKNPSEAPLHHLYGNKYFKIMKNNDLFEVIIVQKVNTGIGTEYDYFGSKTFKTLAGASRWINRNTPPKSNPRKKTVSQKISQLEHEGYPHKQSIAIALSEQRKGKVTRNPRLRTVSISKKNPVKKITQYKGNKDFAGYAVKEHGSEKWIGWFTEQKKAVALAHEIADKTGKSIEVVRSQIVKSTY